jgi:hypothetical protein
VMPAIPGYTAGDFTFVADDAVATLRAAVNHRPSVARLDGYRCPGPPVFPGLVVATLKSARSTEVREPA